MNVFLISQKIEFDSARKVDDKLVIFFSHLSRKQGLTFHANI